ncbi:MAG TPA: YsnF/AvaK domain-containing protein [Caldilineaceae bacterium]|nr:YsnF/AvaK domain-containing protein [Caldilineaceae bacterium]
MHRADAGEGEQPAQPRPVEQAVVLDSDGVPGTVARASLQQAEERVIVTFDGDRRVQVPVEMLHRREDGSYFLPLSLRELESGMVSLGRAGDGNIVAIIPVIQEEAMLRRRTVETGRLRIHKQVRTTEETVTVPHAREHVQVERVPVGQILAEPASVRYEGDTLVIPVMEEVVVVEKRLLLREEVRVTKVREESQREETVTLHVEEVTVERREVPPAAQEGP